MGSHNVSYHVSADAPPPLLPKTAPWPPLNLVLFLSFSCRHLTLQNEYRELSSQCKQYTSDLLDMCQNSKEVALILNQEATSLEQGMNADTTRGHNKDDTNRRADQPESYQGSTLERLKLAVRYNQKQVRIKKNNNQV